MTTKEEREKFFDLAAAQMEALRRHQEMFARSQELLERALDANQRQARLLDWFISGDGQDGGMDDEMPFDVDGRGACAACMEGEGAGHDGEAADGSAVGPGGIPRTSYVQRVDPERFPNLAGQIEDLGRSEAHALAWVPSWTAEKLIGRFGKLVVRHRPNLRAGLADFRDVTARINEFFEMDIEVFAVFGSDTLLMLVDRPSKGVMGLGCDTSLFSESGYLAADIALEVPPKEAAP